MRGILQFCGLLALLALLNLACRASAAAPTPTPAHSTRTPTPTPVKAKLITRGNPNLPRVALTFDAGAGPGDAGALLDFLAARGLKATFFLTGKWAEENPDLARRIAAQGHELGNHSYSHPDLTKVSLAEVESQIDRAEAVIQNISGVSPKPYFRPPFGAWDNRLLEVLGGRGYDAVYWTVDSGDWKADATTEAIISKVVNNAQNGAIVVFHVAGANTLAALPSILDQLGAKGYAVGTLTQTLAP